MRSEIDDGNEGRSVRQTGSVIWLTGLSGAGKSSVATALVLWLNDRAVRTELLDGDAIRELLPDGFSRDHRDANVRRVGYLASRLEHHGITVVCALISPYRSSREWVRRICVHFTEVHVSTPLEVCEARDPKGLYRRARAGEIHHFTGVDDPYEAPERAEVVLDTSILTQQEAVLRIVDAWRPV